VLHFLLIYLQPQKQAETADEWLMSENTPPQEAGSLHCSQAKLLRCLFSAVLHAVQITDQLLP
jgi:hypothetical protein